MNNILQRKQETVTTWCRAVDRFYTTCGDLNIPQVRNLPNGVTDQTPPEPQAFRDLDYKKEFDYYTAIQEQEAKDARELSKKSPKKRFASIIEKRIRKKEKFYMPKYKRTFIWNLKIIEGGWAIKKIKTPEGISKYKYGCASNLIQARRKQRKERDETRKRARSERSRSRTAEARERADLKKRLKAEKLEMAEHERKARRDEKAIIKATKDAEKELRLTRKRESRDSKIRAKEEEAKNKKLLKKVLKSTGVKKRCDKPKTITIKDLIAHEIQIDPGLAHEMEECHEKLKLMRASKTDTEEKQCKESHDPENASPGNHKSLKRIDEDGDQKKPARVKSPQKDAHTSPPKRKSQWEAKSTIEMMLPRQSTLEEQQQTMFMNDKDHLNNLRTPESHIKPRKGKNLKKKDVGGKTPTPPRKRGPKMSINDLMNGLSNVNFTNQTIPNTYLQKRDGIEFMQDFSMNEEEKPTNKKIIKTIETDIGSNSRSARIESKTQKISHESLTFGRNTSRSTEAAPNDKKNKPRKTGIKKFIIDENMKPECNVSLMPGLMSPVREQKDKELKVSTKKVIKNE